MYTKIGILMILLYFIMEFFPLRYQKYIQKTCLFSIIFLFWWITGLSYKLGVDNYNYEFFYYTQLKFDYFEMGYKIINKVFNKYLDFYIFKSIIYFIIVYLFYKAFNYFLNNKKLSFIFIFLYSYGVFYYFYLGFIRQAISISIFAFSLQYIYQKKLIKYTILIIISYMFHKSSLYLYILYFLFNNIIIKNLTRNNILFLLCIYIGKIICKYLHIEILLENILANSFLEGNIYLVIINQYELINMYDICMFIIVLTGILSKNRYSLKEKKIINYYVILYFVYTIFSPFSFMLRMKLYFDIVLFLTFTISLNKYSKIIRILFLVLFFYMFNIRIQKLFYNSIFPYQNYSYKLFKDIELKDTQQFFIINKYKFLKIEEIIKNK